MSGYRLTFGYHGGMPGQQRVHCSFIDHPKPSEPVTLPGSCVHTALLRRRTLNQPTNQPIKQSINQPTNHACSQNQVHVIGCLQNSSTRNYMQTAFPLRPILSNRITLEHR